MRGGCRRRPGRLGRDMAQVSPITSTESNSGRLANGGVHYKRGGGDNSTDTGGREKGSRRDMPSAFGLVESEVRACVCVCVCPCVRACA